MGNLGNHVLQLAERLEREFLYENRVEANIAKMAAITNATREYRIIDNQ